MTGATGPTGAPAGATGPTGSTGTHGIAATGATGTGKPAGTGGTGTAITQKPAGTGLLEKVEEALTKIVTLRVTTAIAEVTDGVIDEESGMMTVSYTAKPTEAACTQIDCALGNLTATQSNLFANNPDYKKLHADNVQLARDVRQETFDLIEKAVKAVLELRKL